MFFWNFLAFSMIHWTLGLTASSSVFRASLVAQTVKRLPTMRETWVRSLGREDPLERRKWQPTPVLLPGESYGWRSLVGYSPWGHTESDTTEATWQQQQGRKFSRPSVYSYCLIQFLKHEEFKTWEGLRAGGVGGDRGWDGWMASLTQWAWVWANSRR